MPTQRSEREWETWRFEYENKGMNSLQSYTLRRLRKHTHHIVVVKVMKANINGVSDLILCVDGVFVAIELKVGTNKTTFNQEVFLDMVKQCHGVTGVARTWLDVKDIVRRAGYDIDKEESTWAKSSG